MRFRHAKAPTSRVAPNRIRSPATREIRDDHDELRSEWKQKPTMISQMFLGMFGMCKPMIAVRRNWTAKKSRKGRQRGCSNLVTHPTNIRIFQALAQPPLRRSP